MQGWAKSFPCAVLEGGKGCFGSFPPRETITGVILESEPREGPSSLSITSGLVGHFPPADFMGAEESQGHIQYI